MRESLESPFIAPAGIDLAPREAAAAPPVVRAPRVVAAFDVGTPKVVAGSAAETGAHRFEKADILVVSSLAVLHENDKIVAKPDLAVSFVYLVLRGIDVVTEQQWHNALEDRSSLWRMSRLHHAEVRLSCKSSVSFSEKIKVECRDVRRAFKRSIEAVQGSQLEVVDDIRDSESHTHFQTLSEVVQWLSSRRRLKNISGCKAILAASGERMPT